MYKENSKDSTHENIGQRERSKARSRNREQELEQEQEQELELGLERKWVWCNILYLCSQVTPRGACRIRRAC